VSSKAIVTPSIAAATADAYADQVVATVDKTMKKVRVSSPDYQSGGSTGENEHDEDDPHRATDSSSGNDIVAIQWDYSNASTISKYDAEEVDNIELMTFHNITIDQLCKMLKTFIGTSRDA